MPHEGLIPHIHLYVSNFMIPVILLTLGNERLFCYWLRFSYDANNIRYDHQWWLTLPTLSRTVDIAKVKNLCGKVLTCFKLASSSPFTTFTGHYPIILMIFLLMMYVLMRWQYCYRKQVGSGRRHSQFGWITSAVPSRPAPIAYCGNIMSARNCSCLQRSVLTTNLFVQDLLPIIFSCLVWTRQLVIWKSVMLVKRADNKTLFCYYCC